MKYKYFYNIFHTFHEIEIFIFHIYLYIYSIYNNVCRTYLLQMDVFVNDGLVPLWVLSLLNILYPSLVLSTVRLLCGDRIQGPINLDYGFQMLM